MIKLGGQLGEPLFERGVIGGNHFDAIFQFANLHAILIGLWAEMLQFGLEVIGLPAIRLHLAHDLFIAHAELLMALGELTILTLPILLVGKYFSLCAAHGGHSYTTTPKTKTGPRERNSGKQLPGDRGAEVAIPAPMRSGYRSYK